MKLRGYLFLWLTMIAIIPQIILTTVLLISYRNTIDDRTVEMAEHQLNSVVQSVSGTYQSIQQAFSALTFYSDDNRSINSILEKYEASGRTFSGYELYQASMEIRPISQIVCYTYRFIDGVYVFTSTGQIFSHTTLTHNIFPTDYNPMGDAWYQETLDLSGNLYFSDLGVHEMFLDDKSRIFVAQSIRDIYSHEVLGVIMLDCTPEMFDLDAYNVMGDMASITLVDTQNGNVLFASNHDETASASDKVLSADVPDTGISVSITFDYRMLGNDLRSSLLLLLMISAFGELCILVFTYWLSGSVIRPITHLSHIVRRQNTMDFVPFTDYIDRRNEIGMLYRAYNTMMNQLNTAVKEKYENHLLILDAQMKALEASINSHFLFNTLESINSMAVISDNDPIATMSQALGDMFRYAIKTDSEQVTLADELHNVQDYVSIQSIRFDNRFTLIVDVPPALLERKMLKLILQPLVENALIHGLRYCTQGDHISISAAEADGILRITVCNNGAPIEPGQLAHIRQMLAQDVHFSSMGQSTHQHIGLKNIQSRLQLYYGKGYGLNIESLPGVDTCITIVIPF